jgi:hypothetical protein
MKRPWIWVVIVANLIGLIVLAFVYPSAMVSPGPLVPAHAELEGNCFACHAPFRGATPDRCVACHVVADIGVQTTRGAPPSIGRPPPSTMPRSRVPRSRDLQGWKPSTFNHDR